MRNPITTTALAVLTSLALAAGAALASPTPSQKCEAAKNLAVGKYALCLHKAQKKFVKGGEADAVALETDELACGTKYLDKWQATEDKAGSGVCPSEGDASPIQDFIDSCVFSAEEALGGGTLPLDVTTCMAALSSTNADLATCSTDLSATDADLLACRNAQITVLSFQSTVTAVFFSAPAGIATGDTVVFSVTMNMSEAVAVEPRRSCDPEYYRTFGCDLAAWEFPAPVAYVLTYSSGYALAGQLDRIEIQEGGVYVDYMIPQTDEIHFDLGHRNVWKVADFDGTWLSGAVPDDLVAATGNIDQPELFDATFYYGNWPTWGTYHYDYTTPLETTIVTKTP